MALPRCRPSSQGTSKRRSRNARGLDDGSLGPAERAETSVPSPIAQRSLRRYISAASEDEGESQFWCRRRCCIERREPDQATVVTCCARLIFDVGRSPGAR